MGILSFLKDAGQKVIDATASDTIKEDRIKEHLKALGLPGTEQVAVSIAGGRVTLTGSLPDQATREKVVVAVGNVDGVEAVDDQLTVERETSPSRFYEVRSGDTLSGIAKAMYGDGSKYMQIFEANKPMLSNPDRIYPGQKLIIPAL